jgi:predicted DNA-binding transcriptional regulator YafY
MDDKTSRLIRLTSILLHLQAKRIITSQELADKFGISQRTVYRDIRTLEQAGVPIISEAGVGYSLLESYRLPPVMFTEQEINALITAQKYIQHNADKSFVADYGSAVTKVKAVLRYDSKEKSELLDERLSVTAEGPGNETRYLSTIQVAVTNFRVLKIKYHTAYSDAVTTREVEPLAVYFTKGNWILIAWCRMRKALREFRLDRILHLTLLDEFFDNRGFSFTEYIKAMSEK